MVQFSLLRRTVFFFRNLILDLAAVQSQSQPQPAGKIYFTIAIDAYLLFMHLKLVARSNSAMRMATF